MSNLYPSLEPSDWESTRDTLQVYSKLIGKIKQSLIPTQKHFWHFGLYPTLSGISTNPMVAGDRVVSLILHLQEHKLKVTTSDGQEETLALDNQSANSICNFALNTLKKWGVEAKIDKSLFTDEKTLPYDKSHAEAFWAATSRLAALLRNFQSQFTEESSPIQIFPHHFDLSLTWFSGRLVPGQNPKDLDNAKEQMTFGFATGDEGIPEPYLYATSYPTPSDWTKATLPDGTSWHTDEWTGGLLLYKDLVNDDKPDKLVMDFLNTTWRSAKRLMR